MRVKRYIVETMPDAMLKIRKDLGGDAVILSTKKIKVGGFLGMFGKIRLEVIAGVDETASAEPATFSAPAPRREPLSPVRQTLVPEQNASRTAETNIRTAVNPVDRQAPAPAASAPAVPYPSRGSIGQTSGGFGAQAYRRTTELLGGSEAQTETAAKPSERHEQKIQPPMLEREEQRVHQVVQETSQASLESASSIEATLNTFNSMMAAAVHPSDEEFRNRLLDDIQQMKTMMNKLAKEHSEEPLLPEPLERIWNHLKTQEVDKDLADSWIKPVYEAWKASGEQLDERSIKQLVRNEVSNFLETRISGGISDTARMVYVAGPTGVGKTTTIAKMAADQIFRNHKKVGFITADTYRISAVEQLRTYASILNVPLEVVQSPGDMKRAAARLENCDLIFMDTAGRNYLNELYVAELHSLLTVKEQSETCLVLSLTSKPGDMKAIAEHFSKYGLDKVIFTKLDETESCGSLFNLLSEYPLQLLFLTNGQNVPDDLIPADRELLLNELLGDEAV